MSWRSYDADACGLLPSHMFEWAVGDVIDPHVVASNVIAERASAQAASRRDVRREQLFEDIGRELVEALEGAGFIAEVASTRGRLTVDFEDPDGVVSEAREDEAKSIVVDATGRHDVAVAVRLDEGFGRVQVSVRRGPRRDASVGSVGTPRTRTTTRVTGRRTIL